MCPRNEMFFAPNHAMPSCSLSLSIQAYVSAFSSCTHHQVPGSRGGTKHMIAEIRHRSKQTSVPITSNPNKLIDRCGSICKLYKWLVKLAELSACTRRNMQARRTTNSFPSLTHETRHTILLAFYKGPGDWITKAIRAITRGPYSHVELLFSNGYGFSSSGQDRGVRSKRIVPDPAKYDVVPLYITPAQERLLQAWCQNQLGRKFDWVGMLRYLLPFIPSNPNRWYCSAICITALQMIGLLTEVPVHISPNALLRMLSQEQQYGLAMEC